ncbi:hydrogenase [Sinimarinibacterium sp. CAU 1509]|uniref:hydrogenase n=1 Tax=Sinimarinibacterium sp. CAU 1509 TaxID=2562283 RepID=UPI00146DDCEC|nr:hydrogenase [Sinimarinibacterium sp. CAU 1509]
MNDDPVSDTPPELQMFQQVLQPAESTMPLLQRIEQLVAERGFIRVDPGNVAEFDNAEGNSVLLLTADPRNNPESWDLLVILPELLKCSPTPLQVGVADPVASAKLAVRYGVRRYPALVFQRGGDAQTYVDALEGLCDWDVYRQTLVDASQKPVSRAPTVGIAVVTAGSTACH